MLDDIERIPVVLEALAEVWVRKPEMRLGQLIHVIAGMNRTPLWVVSDDSMVVNAQILLGQLIDEQTGAEESEARSQDGIAGAQERAGQDSDA